MSTIIFLVNLSLYACIFIYLFTNFEGFGKLHYILSDINYSNIVIIIA